MKLNIKSPKLKICSVNMAFKELGRIDKGVESGKYTPKQHDTLTKRVLNKLTGRK